MASKVLVPAAPFAKLQVTDVKKSPLDSGSGFIIGTDAPARVAHLEHSVRFLQEQHRLMLSGLHTEIEALRERNRDLQFQLIFNKESSPKLASTQEESTEVNDDALRREVSRLEREAGAARAEARAAEARALQLQRLLDVQAEKFRETQEVKTKCNVCREGEDPESSEESRAELRLRLAEAERLVRRLRADAERQRRELQCMKNSLHASLRASGLDGGYGYQNNYHFPPVHAPDFWREPIRDDYHLIASRGRSTRRPLTLPELSAAGQQIHRSNVYGNNHIRPRANGYENKNKMPQGLHGDVAKSPEEISESYLGTSKLTKTTDKSVMSSVATYPELKIVVTKMIPHDKVTNGQTAESLRARPRRHHHRKHTTDHT